LAPVFEIDLCPVFGRNSAHDFISFLMSRACWISGLVGLKTSPLKLR
jgi:hypothetical protein